MWWHSSKLKANAQIDHRLGDLKKMADAVGGIVTAATLAVSATKAATGDEDFADAFQNYAIENEAIKQRAANKNEQDKLKGEAGAEGSEQAAQALSNALSQEQDIDNADVSLYDGSQITDNTVAVDKTAANKTEVEGAYQEHNTPDGKGVIHVNIDKTDMTDSSKVAATVVHEQTRHRLAQTGKTGELTRDQQTDIATSHGNQAEALWSIYSGLNGIDTKSNTSQTDWNNQNRNSNTVQAGTRQIAKVDNNDLKARRFNRGEATLLDQARAKINGNKSLSKEAKQEQLEKLNKLACAAVKCGAGISDNDTKFKEKYSNMQTEGEKLAESGDIYDMLNGLGISTDKTKDQFGYNSQDKSDDVITSHENVVAGVNQASQAVAGVATGASGLGVAAIGCAGTLGPGCVVSVPAGGYLFVDGVKTGAEGLKNLVSDHKYQEGQGVENSFSANTHEGDRPSPTQEAATGTLITVGTAVSVGVVAKKAEDILDGAAALASKADEAIDSVINKVKGVTKGSGGNVADLNGLPLVNPTYAELKAINAGTKLQAHHIMPQYLGQMLGYTKNDMLQHPATLITQFSHTGKKNPNAMHKAINKYLPPMIGGKKANYTNEQIRTGLLNAYKDIDRPELFNSIKHLIE